MSVYKIPKVEFYITNVCNLVCEQCNRFNNHDFRGWQNWNDYQDIYRSWARYVSIDQIVILGGEPLLNPTIISWINGVSDIFQRPVQVLTNGTRLNKVNGLYETLLYSNAWLGISWHNMHRVDDIEKEINQFLQAPIERLDRGHTDNNFGADWVYRDSNNIKIPVWIQDHFVSSSIRVTDLGFELHDSDPIQAHEQCSFAQHHCYHFISGKLYKCGPVALMPEFDKQHQLLLSESDRTLLHSYRPLSVDEFPLRGAVFLDQIKDPLPQCKFCPTNAEYRKIISIHKRDASLA